MTADAPVIVARFARGPDAHLAQITLAEAGIESRLEDEQVNTMLPYLEFATGGIKVVVAAGDARRAREVVAELLAEWEVGSVFGGGDDWTCDACGASVPFEHDVCWSCGAVRGPVVEGPSPAVPAEHEGPEPTAFGPALRPVFLWALLFIAVAMLVAFLSM